MLSNDPAKPRLSLVPPAAPGPVGLCPKCRGLAGPTHTEVACLRARIEHVERQLADVTAIVAPCLPRTKAEADLMHTRI